MREFKYILNKERFENEDQAILYFYKSELPLDDYSPLKDVPYKEWANFTIIDIKDYLGDKVSDNTVSEIYTMIDWFDVYKVHNIMKYLKWIWASSTTVSGVPSEEEIRNHILELICNGIESATNEKETEYLISSGGIYVMLSRDNTKSNDFYVRVHFVLTDGSTD